MNDLFNNPLPPDTPPDPPHIWERNVWKRPVRAWKKDVVALETATRIPNRDLVKLWKAGFTIAVDHKPANRMVRMWWRDEDCGCPSPPKELVREIRCYGNTSHLRTHLQACDQDEHQTLVFIDHTLTPRSLYKLQKAGFTVWRKLDHYCAALTDLMRWEVYAEKDMAGLLGEQKDTIEIINL